MKKKKSSKTPKTLSCELCRNKFIGKSTTFSKKVNGKKVEATMVLCPNCVPLMAK